MDLDEPRTDTGDDGSNEDGWRLCYDKIEQYATQYFAYRPTEEQIIAQNMTSSKFVHGVMDDNSAQTAASQQYHAVESAALGAIYFFIVPRYRPVSGSCITVSSTLIYFTNQGF